MEFKKTQENGDATCNYTIITDKETVLEFLYELRKHVKFNEEWGDIYITPYKKIAGYSHGSFHFTDALLDYKDSKIQYIWANGGWGLMSYYITIEE